MTDEQLFTLESDEPAPAAPVRSEFRPNAPLAVRMRPRSADEIVGQQHLLAAGSPLRVLMQPGAHATGDEQVGTPRTGPAALVLWGPPGTGKTTLAQLISTVSGRRFVEISAVSAGVKDLRAAIEEARRLVAGGGRETVLFVDEVHRFSKSQQDALLPAVENRWVLFIAATTENPYFSVISPLLSRGLVLTLESLSEDEIGRLLDRAVEDPRGLDGALVLRPEARSHLLRIAGGDARRALTALEAGAGAALAGQASAGREAPVELDVDTLSLAVDRAAVRYDKTGDQHYDVASAFIKSLRGSDVDAALHYLARMIEAGEDPRFIARRMIILASEDIGLADPTALTTAVAAAQAVAMIGFPEARLTLAQAAIALALAPKSNAVITAIDAAMRDIAAGAAGPVPPHLRDAHYQGASKLGHGVTYRYAHDAPGAVATQQYAPDVVAEREYYRPTTYGAERGTADLLTRLRGILRGRPSPPGEPGSDGTSA